MKEFERDWKNGEKTSLVIKRYPPSPDRCVAIFGSAHMYQRETIKRIFCNRLNGQEGGYHGDEEN